MVLASAVALSAVAVLVSARAITPALASGMLPRWDLAAHLLNGWTTYDHLAHGRMLGFLWDVWSQGYWPPGQSLFQVPFYAAFGGSLSAGLHSSIAAFVLSGVGSVWLLAHGAGRHAWLPAALVVALMASSPFYLAYASVAMSEMVGASAQVVVLICYAAYERTRSAGATRWLAGSLSLLFFTKYNYFILMAVPLACHVLLTGAGGASPRERVSTLLKAGRAWLSTWPGQLTVAYVLAVTIILASGGFTIAFGRQRLAFRTVGYSLHPLLYGWLVYAWRTHRQGRWNWRELLARDARLEPAFRWFVLPVAVWLMSPFPNHIKDISYLVVNTPMASGAALDGLTGYFSSVRADYFAHPLTFVVCLAAFLVATARYRRQRPIMQLLIVTALLQVAMVSMHHTRDPRFLLMAMPPFWIVSAHELGGGLGRRLPMLATLAGVVGLGASVAAADAVTSAEAFGRRAFEHYTRDDVLADALSAIRRMVPPEGTVAVIGRGDNVSPALMKWQLGPPSGLRTFPHEIARESDLPAIDAADVVVLIAPSEPPPRRATARLMDRVEAGGLVPAAGFAATDPRLPLRVFRRPTPALEQSAR